MELFREPNIDFLSKKWYFLAFSLIFNVATGLVGRVMPQFQIFFVASPLMILLGLSIFALSLGVIGTVWTDHYRDLMAVFS